MLQFVDSVKQTVKHWWVSLLAGLLSLVVGILCLVSPGASLLGLTYVFMAVFLAGGILDIVFAVSNRNRLYGWGWSLAGGILEVALGILLLCLPTPAVTAILIYLVGFWILFRSIWGIGESCQLGTLGLTGWGWMLALSIVSLLFSFLYLMSPAFGGVFLIVFVGVAMLLYGIFRIVMAFELRRLGKDIKELGI